MYAVHDNANTDTYVMLHGTELNPHLPSPVFDNTAPMANDSTSVYVVDPSLYYPTATSYGYYCTGFESPGEWNDHHAVFGVDGADVHYAGSQTENFPYVYYTPSYGYGESPFNPYNPYIPGAMIGVDGSSVGTQSYYISPYPDSVSSSGYYPVIQSGPNVGANISTDTISDVGPSTTHRANTYAAKSSHSSTLASVPVNHSKSASSHTNSLRGTSQISKHNVGTAKRPMSSRNGGTGDSIHGVSSHITKNGNAQSSLQSGGKFVAEANQMKFSYPVGANLSDYTSNTNGQTTASDPWSKFFRRGAFIDSNGNVDPLSEQNRGPRTNKSKNQIVVKAYTTMAGDCNSEGNIVISADKYNKDDLALDFVDAKFFVIKSYSEDDVHKSIKYNVWSSTPNGNRKLNNAYEDAQRVGAGKPRGCPIFLFFSVNSSGQFCGVAEMVGPVDFNKDMDFWQQDKWSGSFPVKWHFIKDVPNPTFRHIILENNEHKPVTNSRDTQVILLKPGLEMLRVFKNYSSETSLLDDFMYYENRQRIMVEERARLLRRGNGHIHVYAPQQPLKLNTVVDRPLKEDGMSAWVEKGAQPNNRSGLEKTTASGTYEVPSTDDVDRAGATSAAQNPLNQNSADAVSTLKMNSLSIHPKQHAEGNFATSPSSTAAPVPVVTPAPATAATVGSRPIKANEATKSSGVITIGTIALDPKALRQVKKDGLAKGGHPK